MTTTKYNLITFLPLSILYQFKRFANTYFVIVAILSSIPSLSAVSPGASWSPIVFVLSPSMAREAIEDYGRYKLDKASNSQKVQVYDPKTHKFVTKKSSETFLGNILMISENERIPTDLVLLASDKDDGTAYIETSSLDGEKNLKPKRIAMDMEKIYPYGKDESSGQLNCLGALQTQGSCQAEARNEQLYQFTGRLRLET